MFPQQLQGRLVQHVGVDECSVQIDDKRRLHGGGVPWDMNGLGLL